LEAGDTAGLETCATTVGRPSRGRIEIYREKLPFSFSLD
jgi:hypothetical protein